VGVEHGFDLGGIDVHAARDDHVLLAVADVHVALVVDVGDVADRLPFVVGQLGELLVGVVITVHRETRAETNSSPASPGAPTVPSSLTMRIWMPPYGFPHDPGLRSWSSGLRTVSTPSSVEP